MRHVREVFQPVIPGFRQFIAIDWSGARGPKLPGLQVASCRPGRGAPRLVRPPTGGHWTRTGLLEFLLATAATDGPVFAGFDMSVAFPFCDLGTYFPGHPQQVVCPRDLWATVDAISHEAEDFYARPFTQPGQPYADYFNAPGYRGPKYDIKRLRVTDQRCLAWTRPSSVFNGVGPGSVGTGSLAGMRFFHAVKQQRRVRAAIWPFDRITGNEFLVAGEIFPRYFVKQAGLDPRRWREKSFLNNALRAYHSVSVPVRDYSEDEIDAIFSAAAMRSLANDPASWKPAAMTTQAARQEGWIFGVQ